MYILLKCCILCQPMSKAISHSKSVFSLIFNRMILLVITPRIMLFSMTCLLPYYFVQNELRKQAALNLEKGSFLLHPFCHLSFNNDVIKCITVCTFS